MPIPFHCPSDTDTNSVAWLRLVSVDDGSVRAALFETSAEGDPLSFCFTRVSSNDDNATLSAAKSLFRHIERIPKLILALSDELSQSVFARDLQIDLPCALAENPFAQGEPAWATVRPSEESPANCLIRKTMARQHPFEPLNRAYKCLTEAFADDMVQDVFDSGLNSVVGLPPLSIQPAAATTRTARPRSSDTIPQPMRQGHGSPRQTRGHSLVERLWAMLAVPPTELPTPAVEGIQLDWPRYEKLMPFQREGVSSLMTMDRILLADDMGLGKTIQAIAAIRILKAQGKVRSCLVVAPAGLLDQWRGEILKWAPELTAIIIRGATERGWQWTADRDVKLVSYDTLRADFGNAGIPALQKAWDVVVADEAQRVKNRDTAASRALKSLKRVRSWALTGTPIENDVDELASIMEFVNHDESGERKRFHPGPYLTNRHRELQLRRKKSDVLHDLPPKTITKLPIELSTQQRKTYDKAVDDGLVYLESLGAEITVRHVLELITRLKQICNRDPQTGASSKLDDIAERLSEITAQGHKALIFSQYTDDTYGVTAAARHLRKFSPLTYTGDMTQEERIDAIERFETHHEHKALILSLRAGGLGLNLQTASYVFHLDRWWNPAIERQAEDRTHRMGQTVRVNVIEYSCINTIEQRIDQILERKQGLFDDLIDEVSLKLSGRLNIDELLGIVGMG